MKTELSKTCFQNAQKCVFLGAILQTFPGPPWNGRAFGTSPKVDL